MSEGVSEKRTRLKVADEAFAKSFTERPFWPFQIEGMPSREAFAAAQELDELLVREYPEFYRGVSVFGSQISGYASKAPRKKKRRPSDVDFMLSYEEPKEQGLNFHQFLTFADGECKRLSKIHGIEMSIARRAPIVPAPPETTMPRASYVESLANMCFWSTQGGEEGMVTSARRQHKEYLKTLPLEIQRKVAWSVTEVLWGRELQRHGKRMQRSTTLQNLYREDREQKMMRIDFLRKQVWRKRVHDIFGI